MLFARAIREFAPDLQVEVWRPECTLREPYVWEDADGITHRVYPSHYLRYKVELSFSLLRAVRLERSSGSNYFWIHGIYNLQAYLLGKILQNSAAIAQSHGGFPIRTMFEISRHRWLRYLYLPLYPLERLFLPKYPQFFALGTQEKSYMLQHLAIPTDRIEMSPTGIYFDHFSPGDKFAARRNCGLKEDAQIILYVGRLSQEKGVRHLIEALSKMVAKFGRVQLLIVGGGPLESDLQQCADDLRLGDRVQFVGYVPAEALPDWYRAADVTVLPSLIDWFPKVAMESMACGTPVVITEGGGAIDIVREFECGLLVPLGDSVRLAESINAMLSGTVCTHPNVERGRGAFDWSVKLSKAFDLFESMTNR